MHNMKTICLSVVLAVSLYSTNIVDATSRPGTCEVFQYLAPCASPPFDPNECAQDSDCPLPEKCCSTVCGFMTCQDRTHTVPAQRAGQCPVSNVVTICTVLEGDPQCSEDNDCPSVQKCCGFGCQGDQKCVDPC
ncbi:uncharacterized protein LOC141903742 [Tubulanus polymorphus]|uniref:uncharacterized protein LOC141903742 n=1 Tax=Tubulanus polymorphus TaxID=672921 RepID=UPI003DA218E6